MKDAYEIVNAFCTMKLYIITKLLVYFHLQSMIKLVGEHWWHRVHLLPVALSGAGHEHGLFGGTGM